LYLVLKLTGRKKNALGLTPVIDVFMRKERGRRVNFHKLMVECLFLEAYLVPASIGKWNLKGGSKGRTEEGDGKVMRFLNNKKKL